MTAPTATDERRAGLVLAVVGAVGFSFKAVLAKLAYPYGLDAITLLALRMGFSLPFLVAMGVLDARRRTEPIARRDLGVLLALGFFGYYLASVLDFAGLQLISAALERIVLYAHPTIVVVLSAMFLGKPLTRHAALALALCTGGIALAMSHDLRTSTASDEVTRGVLLVLGSALSYAIYLMGHGEIVGRLGAPRVSSVATSVASLCCLAHFAATHPLSALRLPWQVYALSLAMALFSTVLPVWAVSEAIRRVGAGTVSLVGTLGPVITLVLGWLLLGEPLGVETAAGAGLVVAGVVVIMRAK